MIVEKIYHHKQAQITRWPCKSNRASLLGHPCIRHLYYKRMKAESEALHTLDLQLIFDEGHHQERAVLRDAADAGIDIIEQQRPFDWPEYNITGHVDGKIRWTDGTLIPLEIKSCSPFVFKKIEDLSSLMTGAQGLYPHLQHYPAQVTLYALMSNVEKSLILFKCKTTGQLKEVVVPLDYEYGEYLLQKAETINKHVKHDQTPEPIHYDDRICGRCGFIAECLPDVKRKGELQFIDDEAMEKTITEWYELKPIVAKYTQIDKEIKERFETIPNMVIGKYLITGYEVTVKNRKPYWKTNIKLIEGL